MNKWIESFTIFLGEQNGIKELYDGFWTDELVAWVSLWTFFLIKVMDIFSFRTDPKVLSSYGFSIKDQGGINTALFLELDESITLRFSSLCLEDCHSFDLTTAFEQFLQIFFS